MAAEISNYTYTTLDPSIIQEYLNDYYNLVSLMQISNTLVVLTSSLGLYLSIPLILVNILGNVANYMVFNRDNFKKVSISFYLRTLAVVDILQSYIILFVFINQFKFEISSTSKLVCDLHSYISMTLPYFSPWVTTIIALDRLIQTTSIKSMRILTNKRYQHGLIAVTITSLSIVNVDVFVDSFYRISASNYTLTTKCLSNSLYSSAFIYVDTFISTIIPFLIMTISNIIVAIELKRSKHKSNVLTHGKNSKIKENKFLIISLSLNILFFITHSVSAILNLYTVPFMEQYPEKWEQVNHLSNEQILNPKYLKAVIEFSVANIQLNILTMAYYLKYLYYIIQFFLYLAINELFRTQFLFMIKTKIRLFKKFNN